MEIGILALQGCIAPHERMLRSLHISSRRVRSAEDLTHIDRIILPGGESTTMLRLLKAYNLFEALREFGASRPIWGICAGSILLASRVEHPEQDSLGLMNIRATRNFYGSQRESFSAEVSIAAFDTPFLVDFIRAPRLAPLSDEVQVLARFNSETILMRQEHLLASAFHTELGEDSRLHAYFAQLPASAVPPPGISTLPTSTRRAA